MKNHTRFGVLILGLFAAAFLFPVFSSAETPKPVTTYDELIKAIRQTRQESKLRTQKAVEQEKVREAWEIGKLIDEHVLLHKERADYGKQVIDRLAADLEVNRSELYYMLEFARTYPNVLPAGQLSWSHYQALLAVNDDTERREIAQQAVADAWTRDQVRAEVRKRKAKGTVLVAGTVPFEQTLPDITPGPLYTWPVIRLQDKLKIDLGFGIYRDVPAEYAGQFEEGDVVTIESNQLRKVAEGYDTLRDVPEEDQTQPLETSGNSKVTSRNPNVTSRNFDNYTYSALVTSVVDGDTFHALIDLGFGITMAERVRLRRVDAPELPTAEGEEAKALLQEILSRDQGRVVIQSRELDQHGRPIADVFVHGTSKSRHEVPEASASGAGWVSVDQELVEKGLAGVMKD